MIWSNFATIIWEVLHKKTFFWALKKLENDFFRPKKMKTSLGNIVCHSNMHPCAQYGIIWTYSRSNFPRFPLNGWNLFFYKRWIKSFWHVTIWSILHKIWSNIFEKWSCAILEQIFGSFFTKKIFLCTQKMENHLFVQRK